MKDAKYKKIVDHYEACFEEHGDTHKGMDWPKLEDVDKRFRVMLDVIRVNSDARDKVSLLDFGCGTAHLLEYMMRNRFGRISYSGLDLSQKFVDAAKAKHPQVEFYCGDIFDRDLKLPNFDYIVMNGVFTEKRDLSFDEMWAYFTEAITLIYERADTGIAFNVMSKHVDWEREDLFHVPLDLLGDFLCRKISRDFIIRNDYGLYEYSVYVYKR